MKLETLVKIIVALTATSCFNQYCLKEINCEQLSSVFVLETSDSQPKSSAISNVESWPSSSSSKEQQRSLSDDTNTKIITDGEEKPINKQRLQEPLNSNSIRRVQSDEQPPSRSSVLRNNNQASSIQQPINQPIRRSSGSSTTSTSTTRPPRNYEQQDSSSPNGNTPKEENRLLISIQSENDDYKPSIIKQPIDSSSISIGNGNSEENKQSKPIITLSFQDSNKHNVIVRPSENGQSIVISTLGAGSGSGSGPFVNQNNQLVNNNYQSQGYNNNNREPPYREPVDSNPYSPLISSTTYRPSVNSNNNYDYTSSRPTYSNSNNPSRPPLVSTLVDNPNRPISGGSSSNSNDELPSRPTNGNFGSSSSNNNNYEPVSSSNSGFGSSSSSGSRPIRPTQDVLLPSSSSSSGYSNLGPNRDPEPIQTPASQYETKYPLNEKNCGLMEGTRIVGGEEVNHDEFLWMAAMIRAKSTNGEAKPFCGGSLITRRHILTAAHCLENLTPRDILVRLGSYDFDDATSSSTSGDYAIDQFRVPANYSKKTHISDIALLRLKTPLSLNDNYKTVCMPQARRSYVGSLGTVIGYGSQNQQFRKAAPKLRQVTVPIWENRKCGVVYKKNVTDSFLCAGFEEGGKDACQGDSGGPLMTNGPNERMMVVGVVSHGIGCGSPEYPGVYTRVTSFLEWIEKNTRD